MRGYLIKKGVSNNVRHGPELESFLVVGSKKSLGGGGVGSQESMIGMNAKMYYNALRIDFNQVW